MRSSYVKDIVWSSLIPCSTWYSTSEVVNSISTSYLTVPVTSYSWTTGTSYTTIFTTVTSTDYTTQITDDTSWTTATTLTTQPVLTTERYSTTQTLLTTKSFSETQYFETTEVILTTKPILTYETIQTTITGSETQKDLETIYTTESVTQTYTTSQIALVTLTSSTTYETVETISVSPPPPPPSQPASNPAPPVLPTSSSPATVPPPPPPSPPPSSVAPPVVAPPSPETSPPPPPVITPPPPPNPCTEPPVNDYFSVSWFGYRPVPGAEPLATVYRTVVAGTNTTISSTFCNTPVFEEYYRTNLFDCARGCGPFQTLDNDCNIVIGPVFTGTTCGGQGFKITQTGPSGNVANFDTSIVGHGLTIDGTCVPVTTTTLQSPFIYTGDIRQVDTFETLLERRQAQSQANLIISTSEIPIPDFDQASRANVQYGDQGVVTNLPGASTLFPEPETVSALPANEPSETASPAQSPTEQPAEQTTSPPPPAETEEPVEPTTSPPPPAPTESRSTPAPATPTERPAASTSSPTAGPPIAPTSESTIVPSGQQGSTQIFPYSDGAALTCVPLSLVMPSSDAVSSAASAAVSSTGASASAPPQQTGNAAAPTVGLSVALGWVWAGVGLYLVV